MISHTDSSVNFTPPPTSLTKPVLLALLIHLIIIAGLLFSEKVSHKFAPKLKPNSIKVEAIKSYIYVPPKPNTPPKKEAIAEPKPELKPEKVVKISTPPKAVTKPTAPAKKQPKQKPKPQNKVAPPKKSTPSKSKPVKASTSKQVLTSKNSNKSISINALRQLDQLRNKVESNLIQQDINELLQHKSVSTMHPNPAAVPKSLVPLTKEQKKQQNTQRMSDHISLVKTDNGTCYVEEDLSDRGMEGLKAVSAFNCGESKFDKSFREHMEKVRKKIGK